MHLYVYAVWLLYGYPFKPPHISLPTQDLLDPSRSNLQLRENDQGVHIAGVKELEVRSMEDCLCHLATGDRNRSTAFTAMNEHSSRSHAIVILTVIKRKKLAASQQGAQKVLYDKFHTVFIMCTIIYSTRHTTTLTTIHRCAVGSSSWSTWQAVSASKSLAAQVFVPMRHVPSTCPSPPWACAWQLVQTSRCMFPFALPSSPACCR